MKYVIILPDGAADEPVAELEGKTTLEAAHIPHMDWVARNGRLGIAVTVPAGFTAGTDVGTMSLMGYDPHQYYTGRAPLEAAAKGLEVGPSEIVYRCNFVTILDGLMKDFTADHINQAEAEQLVTALNEHFAAEPLAFHAGVSYRNLLIAAGLGAPDLRCAPPHDISDQPVNAHRPEGTGAAAVEEVMARAAQVVRGHEVNRIRKSKGRAPVTDIWLWGQGRPTVLEPFAKRFGCRGAVITGVDIIRGLAVCMGMELIEVAGATGYLDTNYKGKGKVAAEALADFDLVIAHVEAPDEAGHLGNAREKVLALERMDEYVVGPLLEAVRQYDAWRILIAPDHPTPVSTKAHSPVPPPFCYAGTGIEAKERQPFSEAAARAGGYFFERGHKLMPCFVGSGQK